MFSCLYASVIFLPALSVYAYHRELVTRVTINCLTTNLISLAIETRNVLNSRSVILIVQKQVMHCNKYEKTRKLASFMHVFWNM